jgi:hypothetical protein
MRLPKFLKGSLILFLMQGFINVDAQVITPSESCFTYNIRVDEVDFLPVATHPNSKINMLRDYDPNPPITGIAWKYPDTQTPVAFISGIKPRIQAKFELNGCTKEIWAKGDGPGNYDAPPKKLVQGIYQATPMHAPLATNKVDFFEPFEMTWYISNSANGPWEPAGMSANPFYVIYKNTPLATNIQVYHSLIYYGCKNAKGQTNQNLIVDKMYEGTFMNQCVQRKDNPSPTKPCMSYWWSPAVGEPDPQQLDNACFFETQDLLRYENGRCGSWANFFRDMILVQGISNSAGPQLVAVFYQPPNMADFFSTFSLNCLAFFGYAPSTDFSTPVFIHAETQPTFFVNNFNFTSRSFYKFHNEYEPLNHQDLPLNTTPVTVPPGTSSVLEFAPQNGSPAQYNSNPQSTFSDHGIVKYNNKYYDPSYGSLICSSANQWENISLSGFGMANRLAYNYYDPLDGVYKLAHIMYVCRLPENSTVQK